MFIGHLVVDTTAITAMMDIIECLRILSAVTYPSTIVGDFNLPHIDWNDLSAPSDRIYFPFIEFVNDTGMSQFVTAPTRGEDILDLVLANDAYVVSNCWVKSPFGFNQLVAKTGVGPIKDQSGHTLHDDKDKAECFNRFFRLYLRVIMELYQILMIKCK